MLDLAGNYVVERVGDKKIIDIDCTQLSGADTFTNPEFLLAIFDILRKEKNADELSLGGADYRRNYDKQAVITLEQARRAAALAVASLSYKITDFCENCAAQRVKKLLEIKRTLAGDPVSAYFEALEEWYKKPVTARCTACSQKYREILRKILTPLEKTRLIQEAKKMGQKTEIYHSLFTPITLPSFISSYVELKPPTNAKLVDEYDVGAAKVQIFDVPEMPEKLYFITPPELRLHEDENKAVAEALDRISREEAEVVSPREAQDRFKRLAEAALSSKRQKLGAERTSILVDIVTRYSAGYGILETVLRDSRLQDVYVDSPGGTPIYAYHQDYEECVTNIVPTKFELEKLSSRLRALSGRPFDESAPVLHTELEDLGVRVAALCPPATFGGIGFAFRRHRPKPWTLAQFVKAKMLDSKTAGFLSFLVDGQRSILVTGPRGSGKSSLLAALIAEIPPIFRQIIIEDTPELPVEDLKKTGYKIQHLRTRPSFGGQSQESYELSAEEALRTALRLGESVLILGEVRGPEARALFEAMRVGAAGNVVMGTIHGSSAYDTWDRIVNDLGVPSTSFKATDVVVSVAAMRKAEQVKRERRLLEITEVRKDWKQDPHHENGFASLASYEAGKDSWKLHSKNIEKSAVLKDICKLKRITMAEALKNIEFRGQVKQLLADYSEKCELPELLEIEATVHFNNEYQRLIQEQLEKRHKIDYSSLLSSMEKKLKAYAEERKA